MILFTDSTACVKTRIHSRDSNPGIQALESQLRRKLTESQNLECNMFLKFINTAADNYGIISTCLFNSPEDSINGYVVNNYHE